MSSSEAAIAISEAAEEDEEVLIPSLPNDVASICLARVPRSKHLTLSLVSKPIRSLISSPLFFNVRSSIPHSTEPILYLVLYYATKWGHGYRMLTLYRNPFNSATTDTDNVVPVPSPSLPSSISFSHSAIAVLGTKIYVIGGTRHFGRHSSSEVWVLDCRINSWRRGPTMLAPRSEVVANVVDGKIYVIGGCNSSIQAEVLDPELGKWVEFVCPFTIDYKTWSIITFKKEGNPIFVKDDKLYIYEKGNHVYVFNPQGEGSWSRTMMPNPMYSGSLFVDGIFYSCNSRGGIIRWCDVKEDGVWKDLKYLDNNLVFPMSDCESCALTYASGNLVLLGGKMYAKGKNNNEIWYAEIQVTKKDGELWGKVCRSQIILSTLPHHTFRVHKCIAVDL